MHALMDKLNHMVLSFSVVQFRANDLASPKETIKMIRLKFLFDLTSTIEPNSEQFQNSDKNFHPSLMATKPWKNIKFQILQFQI